MERALRERGERPHLLDLVAEELHPKRLAAGRREHVDDAAANRAMATLLDPVHPVVPGGRERGDAARRRRARPRPRSAPTVGSVAEIGKPLGQRDGRRTHQPTRGEQLQRAKALTDQVGRRLEPRGLGDPPTGVERNRLRPEEPRRTLGSVARIRVLGEKDEKRPPELGVERGEHERKRCLRHPRAGGERLRVRDEPVAPAKLVDERRERHDGVT